MSKQRIIEGIDAMFQNLSPPGPIMHVVERRICIQNREREYEIVRREVARVFDQRDELLAACKALMHEAIWSGAVHLNDLGWPKAVKKARAAIAKAEGGQDE